jgi:predicted acyltransferase (DUF342 family)
VRLSIAANGNTGIGINPSITHKLNVGGNARFTGYVNAESNLIVSGSTYIGIAPNASYKLLVNGDSRLQGDGTITGLLDAGSIQTASTIHAGTRAAIGGNIDNNFRLRVYDGASRFGGDVEVTGNMTIGGTLDNTYKLRVIGGNSRFGGDAQVTGSLDVGGNIDLTGQINAGSVNTGALAIGGKGSVRSDGLSPLRIGFNSKYVNVNVGLVTPVTVTANITDFAGDNDDVRVMVCQFVDDGSYADAWENMIATVHDVDAASNTCKISLTNKSNGGVVLKGTIYLMTVAKN